MNGVIYIATLPNGFFGSSGASWKSLSPDKIGAGLRRKGYVVEIISISEILDRDLTEEDVIFYTSSDDEVIRNYVKDLIYLANKFCHVAPSMDALMAHENKGFQQLYRKVFQFGDLDGSYFFHKDAAPKQYPFVYKTATGAGSSGVELIRNDGDLKKIKSNFKVGCRRAILLFLRWIKLKKDEFDIYSYRHKGKCLSVAQEFIPGLAGDYKVLIFGKKLFVLERLVAEGSFKASGSGNFRFPSIEELPKGMLDYAYAIYNKLDVPYISLDIAKSEKRFHLIEYQATNFGPYTLVNSKGYFFDNNGEWSYAKAQNDLEECFSDALIDYMERKK